MQKTGLLFLFVICCVFGQVAAQTAESENFNRGVEFYLDNRYEEARRLFEQENTPVARLFLSKTLYALGRYSAAIETAQRITSAQYLEVTQEAQYVRALSHFQLKEHNRALELLYQLKENAQSPGLRETSLEYYISIINYLSLNQRMASIQATQNLSIREDVVKGHFERYQRSSAIQLVEALSRLNRSRGDYRELLQNARALPESVTKIYDVAQPPAGTTIHIGVLLPAFENSPEDKSVSKAIYDGLLLAADEFNRNNNSQKIQLHYRNTENRRSNLSTIVSNLVNETKVDFIVGPLFSEDVSEIERTAERLRIPVLAPLANTISLNPDNKFVFQVNPSFESKGRRTARYAVEELGLTKFGVMVESGTLGEIEANAFRSEVESLGGEVVRFISADFARTGYFVGEHLPWFANNPLLIDTTRYVADTLDAIFIPFTGDAAPALLNLTLTGLEAYQPSYIILGNEELGQLTHSAERVRRLHMMYNNTFFLNEASERSTNFRYDYINRTGSTPNLFSYIGYDIGSYIAFLLKQIGNPDNIDQYIDVIENFNGLATSIYFGDSNVNQELRFFRITPGGSVRVD